MMLHVNTIYKSQLGTYLSTCLGMAWVLAHVLAWLRSWRVSQLVTAHVDDSTLGMCHQGCS